MTATVLGIVVLVVVVLGAAAVDWYFTQWDVGGSRQAASDARAGADAAVRQAELRVTAHAEPAARARVLGAYGRVLSMKGDTEHATFVVEIRTTSSNNGSVSTTNCFSIEFDAWQGRVDKSVHCPARATQISLPPPPTTLASLGDYIDQIRTALVALPPGARRSPSTVQGTITAIVGPHGATVEASRVDSVVGAAIRRAADQDCVFVRIADDIEIWRPRSVYRLYGQAGETRCASANAIVKDEQQPPH